MSYTPPTLPPMPEERRTRVISEPRPSVRRISRPRPVSRPSRFSRRYDIEWLENGEALSATKTALALPAFEQAFGAFTHGVLIQTADGPVAVEDLVPGMWLECADGHLSQLLWKGSITLIPGAPSSMDEPDRLYRVMPDAFGLGRPVQDQTFGPHARRINRDPQLRATLGTEAALVPLSSMADGMSVIEVTPVAPTRVYHLACERHETLLAAGLEIESYHPGPDVPLSLPEEMMAQFMTFFPHLTTIRDFGRLAAPRVSADEMIALTG